MNLFLSVSLWFRNADPQDPKLSESWFLALQEIELHKNNKYSLRIFFLTFKYHLFNPRGVYSCVGCYQNIKYKSRETEIKKMGNAQKKEERILYAFTTPIITFKLTATLRIQQIKPKTKILVHASPQEYIWLKFKEWFSQGGGGENEFSRKYTLLL